MTNKLDVIHIFWKKIHKFWPNLSNLWQFLAPWKPIFINFETRFRFWVHNRDPGFQNRFWTHYFDSVYTMGWKSYFLSQKKNQISSCFELEGMYEK